MIAPKTANHDHKVVNHVFEQMLPTIRLMALHAFRDHDREFRYELTAEVIARAFAAFVRLAQDGRGHAGYAASLAVISIRQVRSGRRMGSPLNVNDISSEYAQLAKGINLARLDRYDDHAAAWRCSPAEIAIMWIDFVAWLQSPTSLGQPFKLRNSSLGSRTTAANQTDRAQQ